MPKLATQVVAGKTYRVVALHQGDAHDIDKLRGMLITPCRGHGGFPEKDRDGFFNGCWGFLPQGYQPRPIPSGYEVDDNDYDEQHMYFMGVHVEELTAEKAAKEEQEEVKFVESRQLQLEKAGEYLKSLRQGGER